MLHPYHQTGRADARILSPFRALSPAPGGDRIGRALYHPARAALPALHLAARDFVAGSRFTMGDIPLGIMVYRWYELPIERENYPSLRTWFDRLAARPAFRKNVMFGLS